MSSIDERIVQMRFDNKQFEGGVQESIKSLNNLKQGLNLNGATASLSNLEKVGRSFSLAGIASGVDAIASKFSTLGIIGVTALANITNSAINAGKSLVSSLTLDPIIEGFNEYETKMNSIQTILTNTASKGTTLKDVNGALNELNKYSDLTIYNFAQMTDNIGKMTAAGLGLKDSVTVVKGLSNVAAGFGVDATRMAGATYQVSQALASGTIRLQDWVSLEQAGMGGEMLQKELINTAKSMGKVVDTGKPFRQTLQDGWLTTDIFVKTMDKMAKNKSLINAAQNITSFTKLLGTMKESIGSGWAQTWENIFGNKEQSTKLFTDLNNSFNSIIGPSANARNAMLAFWNTNGGRDAMIQGLGNAFNALGAILKPVGQAFRDVFPAMTGKRLVEISKEIKDFTAGLKISDATSKNIRNTFQGLFAVLDIIKQAVTAAGKAFFDMVGYILPAGNGLLSITGSIGIFLKNIDDTIKKTGVFNSIFSNFATVIKAAVNIIGLALSGSAKGISYFVNLIIIGLTPLSSIGDFLGAVFSAIGTVLSKLGPIFTKVSDVISNALDRIRNSISGGDTTAVDMLNTGLFAAILLAVKKFIKKLPTLTDMAEGILGKVTGVLDGVKKSLAAYQSQLKAGTLLKISVAIGILAASLLILSTIDGKRLASSLAAVTTMFIELFVSMAAFEKLSGGGLLSMSKLSIGMIGLSTAVLILSGAMSNLAKLDWNGIAKGLVGIGVIMAELAIFMKVSNFSGMGVSTGLGIIALAAGIAILAEAVKIFASLDIGAMMQGLLGIGTILAEITIFVKATGNTKGIFSTAVGLILLGTAMLIFANAIKIMGSMPLGNIAKGLLTIAASLGIVIAAIGLMPASGMITAGLALTTISMALVILSGALTVMGSMSWDAVAKGLVVLAGSMTILAVSMSFMQGALPGAAALLIVAAALSIFAPVLLLLGSMPLSNIGTSLLVLAGTFTILGIAGLVLAPLTPVLIALAGAVALFGLGCIAVGAGMVAFALGITMLATASTAGVVAITLMVTSIVSLIPFVVTSLANGLVQFINLIATAAPTIVTALISIALAILNGFNTIIPAICNTFLNLVVSILNIIANNIPRIVVAAANIIVAFLNGISQQIPRVIQAAITLVISFINGLANGLRNNQGSLTSAVRNLMSSMITTAVSVVNGAVGEFFSVGANIIRGLINGIKSKIGEVASSAANLAHSALQSAKNALGIQSPSREFGEVGMYSCEGFAGGLTKYAGLVVSSAKDLGNSAINSLKSTISKISGTVDDNIDSSPVIKPVLDLSNIQDSSKRINGLFTGTSLNMSSVTSKLPNVQGQNFYNDNINQNGGNPQGSQISFTQNNYSPTALSRLDIYRQTRNQISALKGLVEA